MEIPDCMLVVAEENCYNRLGDCETLGFGCSRRDRPTGAAKT